MKQSEILVDALNYVKRFSENIFVIKLGGEVLQDKEVLDTVAQDLILLDQINIHPVVIHGAGGDISNAMEKFGLKPNFVDGLRVTDKETMDIVTMVLGKANSRIVSYINKHGGDSIGLTGKSGKLFITKAKVHKKSDLGFVGEIEKVNSKIVTLQIENDLIPVISPIGIDSAGNSYNINADDAAAKLAVALKASKLIYLTNVKGVLDKKGELIKRIILPEIPKLQKSGALSGGMIPKINSCAVALRGGVERAHLVKAEHHAILEEILTSTGNGTMIAKKKIIE